MKKYYFTFGQAHKTTDGIPLEDYWIEVLSDDYWKARQIFVEQFSSVYLPRKDVWAFEYTEENFKPQYFPGGCYLVIFPEESTNFAREYLSI